MCLGDASRETCLESKSFKNSVSVLYAWIASSHIPHAKEAKRDYICPALSCLFNPCNGAVSWILASHFTDVDHRCLHGYSMADLDSCPCWSDFRAQALCFPISAFPRIPKLEGALEIIQFYPNTHTHTHPLKIK